MVMIHDRNTGPVKENKLLEWQIVFISHWVVQKKLQLWESSVSFFSLLFHWVWHLTLTRVNFSHFQREWWKSTVFAFVLSWE